MGLKPVSELKNKHKDKDIYVLGSGATLNFIDKEFFKDKITVSVNEVGSVYLPTTNAKNIILVAHDCGELDDKAWVNGYVYDTMLDDEEYINNVKSRAVQFEAQTIQLKQKLQEVYGCNIYSLNPFINYSLEGHKYRGTSVIN